MTHFKSALKSICSTPPLVDACSLVLDSDGVTNFFSKKGSITFSKQIQGENTSSSFLYSFRTHRIHLVPNSFTSNIPFFDCFSQRSLVLPEMLPAVLFRCLVGGKMKREEKQATIAEHSNCRHERLFSFLSQSFPHIKQVFNGFLKEACTY